MKIALAVLLSVALSGFAAAPEAGPHARMAEGAHRAEARSAVTAIKAIVNHSRFRVEVRNTENPHQERNGADIPPISPPHPVEMWIPWARTSSEFRTHHIRVVLWDGSRQVRRFVIWQRADFDGDFVRVGRIQNLDSTELGYAEPGTRIPGVSTVGGDRTLVVSASGDLSLSGFR